jgi:hypothetical protein
LQTLTFITDDTTPQCTINVLSNTLWQVDQATVLSCNCTNYNA